MKVLMYWLSIILLARVLVGPFLWPTGIAERGKVRVETEDKVVSPPPPLPRTQSSPVFSEVRVSMRFDRISLVGLSRVAVVLVLSNACLVLKVIQRRF